MKSIRSLSILVSAFLLLASPSGASAGDAWRIVESAGAVKAGGAGLTPAAVRTDQVLPSDAWVETAATGRAILVRGAESIAVGPNSRVQLPSLAVNGNTQVLQTLGSAFYQIGKQQKPHFQVDTPYLAAVVKGTTFTVTVNEGVASVQVTEGLVEVATPDRADVEFVRPGFTGLVSRDHRGDVVVVPSDRGEVQPPVNGKAKDKSTSNARGVKLASIGTERVVITRAIGEEKIDVKAASGGLAFNVADPAVATKDTTTRSISDGAVTETTDPVESLGGTVAGAASETASTVVAVAEPVVTPVVGAVADVVPSVSVDVATPQLGGGASVSVDVGVGGSNGNGGTSIVSVDAGVGTGGVSVGVGVGVGNGGSGVSLGVTLGGGLGIKLGLGH